MYAKDDIKKEIRSCIQKLINQSKAKRRISEASSESDSQAGKSEDEGDEGDIQQTFDRFKSSSIRDPLPPLSFASLSTFYTHSKEKQRIIRKPISRLKPKPFLPEPIISTPVVPVLQVIPSQKKEPPSNIYVEKFAFSVGSFDFEERVLQLENQLSSYALEFFICVGKWWQWFVNQNHSALLPSETSSALWPILLKVDEALCFLKNNELKKTLTSLFEETMTPSKSTIFVIKANQEAEKLQKAYREELEMFLRQKIICTMRYHFFDIYLKISSILNHFDHIIKRISVLNFLAFSFVYEPNLNMQKEVILNMLRIPLANREKVKRSVDNVFVFSKEYIFKSLKGHYQSVSSLLNSLPTNNFFFQGKTIREESIEPVFTTFSTQFNDSIIHYKALRQETSDFNSFFKVFNEIGKNWTKTPVLTCEIKDKSAYYDIKTFINNFYKEASKTNPISKNFLFSQSPLAFTLTPISSQMVEILNSKTSEKQWSSLSHSWNSLPQVLMRELEKNENEPCEGFETLIKIYHHFLELDNYIMNFVILKRFLSFYKDIIKTFLSALKANSFNLLDMALYERIRIDLLNRFLIVKYPFSLYDKFLNSEELGFVKIYIKGQIQLIEKFLDTSGVEFGRNQTKIKTLVENASLLIKQEQCSSNEVDSGKGFCFDKNEDYRFSAYPLYSFAFDDFLTLIQGKEVPVFGINCKTAWLKYKDLHKEFNKTLEIINKD